MKIEQIYTGCLAQGTYYITSNGEAAIIDPLRDITSYLNRAEKDGVKIKYIFETHFHADFVSGHIDLSEKTGAPIIYGPLAETEFDAIIAEDGQEFKLGELTIKVLHTPGHTMESTTYLLKDKDGKDVAIFSGDTLFLGDVGRPDLAQQLGGITIQDLAGNLYDSLMTKIMPLADDVMVYPAHGAGSACGKNMMKETMDTLGHQKEMNYALNQPDKQSFIAAVTDGLTPPPAYFPMNVAMNKRGYANIAEVIQSGLNKIAINDLENLVEFNGAIILDTRTPGEFAKGFIPKSINIGIAGDFAPWAGSIIGDVNQTIILVCESGQEEECITRLSRVGFDKVLGYLDGGFDAWKKAHKEVDSVHRINAEEFVESYTKTSDTIIDVRKDSEFATNHIKDAETKPLAFINEWTKNLPTNKHFFLHCAGGYRSMIAASILKSRGIHDFTEIEGGFGAIAKLNSSAIQFEALDLVKN